MLNCLLAPVAAEPEFGPELARAEPPAAEAVEPLWSAELAFAPPQDLGAFPELFRFADRLNLTYNLVPSLHVALSVLCIAAFSARANPAGKVLFWIWAVAIALSTLLTHQHHVIDVVAGFALALIAYRFVYLKRFNRVERTR